MFLILFFLDCRKNSLYLVISFFKGFSNVFKLLFVLIELICSFNVDCNFWNDSGVNFVDEDFGSFWFLVVFVGNGIGNNLVVFYYGDMIFCYVVCWFDDSGCFFIFYLINLGYLGFFVLFC